MKKFGFLVIAGALLAATTAAYANTNEAQDGIVIWSETGTGNSNIADVNRTNFTPDGNNIKDQLAQLTIEAKAYIPCYLKMVFNGNDGKTTLESFGPKVGNNDNAGQAICNEKKYYILFDNEVGGFVDSNWTSLGIGRNAEVEPGEGRYIQACDTFHVQIYSNDDFQYDVISQPLTNKDKKLALEMGTSTTLKGTYKNDVFDTANKTVPIGKGNPCSTLEYFHRFRVPYTTAVAQGEYNGTVTFKAYTL